jgi:RHS repeat-associated protein
VHELSGASVDESTYTYDRDGNVLTKDNAVLDAGSNTSMDETYTYDSLNRLATFARGTDSQSWALDAVGNMSTVTTDGTDQDNTSNADNQITSVNGNTSAVTYDADGNTLTDGTGNQFVYDAWNRLTAVKDSDGDTLETMSYDGLGRKVTITQGSGEGATTQALYYSSQWQVLEERAMSGGVPASTASTQYVWNPLYVDAMICRNTAAGSRLYATYDADFNVTSIVDGATNSQTFGQVVERYAYDPYGDSTVLSATDFTPVSGNTSAFGWQYLSQGRRYDSISGLLNARNREYSLTLSRWMQQDPAAYIDGPSMYQYVRGNPINRVDPFGLCEDKVDDSDNASEYIEGAAESMGAKVVKKVAGRAVIVAKIIKVARAKTIGKAATEAAKAAGSLAGAELAIAAAAAVTAPLLALGPVGAITAAVLVGVAGVAGGIAGEEGTGAVIDAAKQGVKVDVPSSNFGSVAEQQDRILGGW